MDLLVRVCREDGLTMVCTLHQIEVALQWTSRVVGLRLGEIKLDEPTELLDAVRLRGLYASDPVAVS
jgi:phosphonate transport system ATP-binding protein